jgi:ATP-dependent HslUV protease ATP-binding subunit HslU
MIRDLTEVSLQMTRERLRKEVAAKAELAAEERLVTALVGEGASAETRMKFRRLLREGKLEDKEVEIQVAESAGVPIGMLDIPGMPGAQMLNIQEMMSKMFGGRQKPRRTTVSEARQLLQQEESDRLLDQDRVRREAIEAVENQGIVFIDEIDKVCARSIDGSGFRGGDVSREGVQRDLLPLIEGTTVTTKHGPVKTDHVLFICSGAFHLAKPSDLLPELQGRLPIRVELKPLSRDDLKRILVEPEASLIRQYVALMQTERVELRFTEDAIETLADLAAVINERVENIGARRLHTVLEKLLDEISFTAADRPGETITVDAAYVKERVAPLAANADLSRFIL